MQSQFLQLLNLLCILIFASVATAFYLRYERFKVLLCGRRAPHFLYAALCLSLFPYFILFDSSYVAFQDEGDFIVPFLNYLAHFHDGGRFTHNLMGGTDVYSLNFSGTQYFYLERSLLQLIPVWGMILFHKFFIYSVGYWGTYLLCREQDNVDRLVAVSLAILFVFSLPTFDDTISRGLGIFGFPMMMYIVGYKLTGRYAGSYIFLLAVITSTLPPGHILPAGLAACIIAWLMLSGRLFGRFAFAILCALAANLANWHEVIYAMALTLPESSRQGLLDVPQVAGRLNIAWNALSSFILSQKWYINLFWIGGLATLAWRRNSFFKPALIGIGVAIAMIVVSIAFPWPDSKIMAVAYSVFSRISNMFIPLTLPIAASAMTLKPFGSFPGLGIRPAYPAMLCLALALALLASSRGNMIFRLVHGDNQATYHAIGNLSKAQWYGDRGSRLVSLEGGDLRSNVVGGFYGFDTYGGKYNVFSNRWAQFFWAGVLRQDRENSPPIFIQIIHNYRYWDWENLEFDFDKIADARLLRIANVEFVVSSLPLKGAGLYEVSGPKRIERARIMQRTRDEKWAYYRMRWNETLHGRDMSIFSLGRPLPRVYAAKKIVLVENDINRESFIKRISDDAFGGAAVIKHADAVKLNATVGSNLVREFRLLPDRIEVDLETSGPALVLINSPYSNFWRAWSNGVELNVVPANMIHMAVAVPSGGSQLTLRYCRPLLRERLLNVFGAKFGCDDRYGAANAT